MKHEFADVADPPQGQAAQMILATELLQSAFRGDHPELVPPLRATSKRSVKRSR
ncbi:hypothetical protein AB0B15_30900 [Streptomyces sp. NPDC045456]|uniref:hypothetical protein n=1 Tax=Streptomyces sp. NPDC045456 TaxID=3155254 RepID=UPI0033F89633